MRNTANMPGWLILVVVGSDNHRVNIEAPGIGLDPALGYPVTAVYATELSWDAIMEGVRAGQTAIFDGNSRLMVDGYNAEGCREENNNTRIIRVRGTVDENLDESTLLLTRATTCIDPRPDHTQLFTIEEDTLIHQTFAGGDSFDLRADILLQDIGVYSATLSGNIQGHYGALSRAIVIR